MNDDGVKNYIRQTAGGMKQDQLFNRIVVYQQNPLPDGISVEEAIQQIEGSVPQYFCNDIDSIFVGQFPFLVERELEALYENGAIYITNEQETVEDFVADLVHEIAHAVEETYPLDIYGDGVLESEFLAKRRTMREILTAHDLCPYGLDVFLNSDYSAEFDTYLYQDIGYDLLGSLLEGLFVSPYGATSLREYFANCFEEFFTGDPYHVKSITPAAYNKLVGIQGY